MLFAAIALAVTWTLQNPAFHFGDLKPFVRYGIPILLATGLVGAFLRKRLLIRIGWVGAVFLLVTTLLTVVPGEDNVLSMENPGAVSTGSLSVRILVAVLIFATQAMCLRLMSRRLSESKPHHGLL